MKKVLFVVVNLCLLVYVALWAWSISWIDSNNELSFRKSLVPIAKTAWKITPALDADKDAQRLLKIASFSVLPGDTNIIDYTTLEGSLKGIL